jgi:hypothetical protein
VEAQKFGPGVQNSSFNKKNGNTTSSPDIKRKYVSIMNDFMPTHATEMKRTHTATKNH